MFRRAFAYASVLIIVFGFALTSASAGVDRHAALILDANTGAVLHDVDGEAPRHPASLTKMMTLYLTFETLQSGRLRMSDKLTISAHAAAQAPSKLGLKPGDQITVENAIKAIVTKSANDIAVALAEKVGGSEPNFARLMTARAREFGMTGTNYENASGLPNDEQITTARDMATLALHLQDDFPQYYPFFSTHVFSYRGKSYRNHNTMLKSFAGIDGIKTGYTRASGFNLVTSLHRGERHLIGVVFGGRTAAKRNAEMRVLLTRMLARASRKKTRRPMMLARLRNEPRIARRQTQPRPAIVAEAERTRPVREAVPVRDAAPERVVDESSETPVHIFKVRAVPIAVKPPRAAPAQQDSTDMENTGREPDRIVPPVRESAPGTIRVGSAAQPRQEQPSQIRQFAPANFAESRAPLTTASNPPQRQQWQPQNVADADTHSPPVIRGMPPSTLGAQARALTTPGSGERFEPRRRTASVANDGGYAVQIGAYSSIDDAQRALTKVQDRAGRLLTGISTVTNPTMKNGHQLFRARFTGFDAGRAASTCNALRRQSVDCFVMAGD